MKRIVKLFKHMKLKHIAKRRPEWIDWIMRGLDYNQDHKEIKWYDIILVEGPVALEPSLLQEEINESLAVVGYGYDIACMVGEERTTLVINHNGEFVKIVVFFNNQKDLIIERLNGFIGIDTSLMCALLDHGLKASGEKATRLGK